LQGILNEQDDYNDNFDMRSISHALRFLEGIDYEEEALRLRRRQRARRPALGVPCLINS
jgi:hypothetical protein